MRRLIPQRESKALLLFLVPPFSHHPCRSNPAFLPLLPWCQLHFLPLWGKIHTFWTKHISVFFHTYISYSIIWPYLLPFSFLFFLLLFIPLLLYHSYLVLYLFSVFLFVFLSSPVCSVLYYTVLSTSFSQLYFFLLLLLSWLPFPISLSLRRRLSSRISFNEK